MASVAPFSRRQWASQSLRVTAKEMSIISARGKKTAIAERFSKYVTPTSASQELNNLQAASRLYHLSPLSLRGNEVAGSPQNTSLPPRRLRCPYFCGSYHTISNRFLTSCSCSVYLTEVNSLFACTNTDASPRHII